MSKQKLPRTIGVSRLLKREFDTYDFDGEWRASIGEPEKNFRAFVYGRSGNGKTDFVVKWAKYLSGFGKVYYNSCEEGLSKSMQKAFERNDMANAPGTVVLGDQESWETMLRRMSSKNSPRFCVLDSLDYINLTKDMYQQFVDRCPNKSIIIISWATGSRPKTQAGKDIEYMCDIKIEVKDYKAYVRSRFGGGDPFVIWPEYWEKRAAEAEAKAASLKYDKKAKGQKAPDAAAKGGSQSETMETEADPLSSFITQFQNY